MRILTFVPGVNSPGSEINSVKGPENIYSGMKYLVPGVDSVKTWKTELLPVYLTVCLLGQPLLYHEILRPGKAQRENIFIR